MRDLYADLELTPAATAAEIRAAFRRLTKLLHPDRTGGDEKAEARYRAVTAAYSVLSDDDLRHKYDAARAAEGTPEAASRLREFLLRHAEAVWRDVCGEVPELQALLDEFRARDWVGVGHTALGLARRFLKP